MSNLVPPHGADALKPLLLPEAERAAEVARAEGLKKVPLSSREVSDLFMLGMGAYTPLDGFMSEADWRGSCEKMQLSNGVFWPIPITLSASQELADTIGDGEEVALTDRETGEILGTMVVSAKYGIDKDLECQSVYGTTDGAHPGVQKVLEQGPVNLGGSVRVVSEGHFPDTYEGLYLRPAETRALFEEKGWSTVAAFQTRNPMHCSHEFLAKTAVEVCDPSGAGRAQTWRYSSRRARESYRCTGAKLFRPRNGRSGGLPDRDALCGSEGSLVACRIPPELWMFASGGRTRSCWCR